MPGKRAPEDKRREDILKAAYKVARRQRLAKLTSRGVAAEANVSNGLVFFHFKNTDELLLELLDWVLSQTGIASIRHEEADAGGDPAERMVAMVQAAIARLPRERHLLELFFEYWFMATANSEIRRRIRAALGRYREGYLPMARAVLKAHPGRYGNVPAESLASVVAGFVEGCALQVVVDPKRFKVEDYCEAVRALVLRN